MLTFTSKSQSSVDFDLESLQQAANLLLGNSKTELLFSDKTSKGILSLVSHLENQAKAFKANPQTPLPKDTIIPQGISDPAALRSQYVADILNLKFLQESPATTNQLAFRLRGPNQLRAFFQNEATVSEDPNKNEVDLRVSLKDLGKTISEAEETGRTTLKLTLPQERVQSLQQAIQTDAKFILTFQDEISERPEVRRAHIGNISKRCENQALLKGSTPLQEASPFIEKFSGTTTVLSNNCEPSKLTILSQRNNLQTIEVHLEFPRILPLILREEQKRQKEVEQGIASIHSKAILNPGQGALTDRHLSQHAARTYGCNGRDFVAASKTITEALTKNLHQAIRTWSKLPPETSITPELEAGFCREYALLSLSLRQRPVPLHKLEPAARPTILRDLTDIAPTTPDDIEYPYIQPIIQQTNDYAANRPVLISAGKEWVQNIVNNRIEKQYHSQAGLSYVQHLEDIFSISDAALKIALIESNIYQNTISPSAISLEGPSFPDPIAPLDGPASTLEFNTVYMTERMDEEFEEEKQRIEDESFSEKLDDEELAKKRINRVDQLHKVDPTSLKLINRPIVLHRLRSYSWKTHGLNIHKPDPQKPDIARELPDLQPLTLPRKEDGTALEIRDLLTPEAYNEAMRQAKDNPKIETTLNSLRERLEQWQLDFRKIDRENRTTWQRQLLSNSKNPLERHLHRWLSDVCKNIPGSRCASFQELNQLFTPTLQNCAPIPQNIDKTPEYFRPATWSSPLPLLLLSGTGEHQLKSLHKDAPSLVDMAARWTNATPVSEPIFEQSETLLQELEQTLQHQTQEDFLHAATEHAIKVELSQPPDYTLDYVRSNNLPVYPSLIEPALKPLTEIYLPLRKSPETMLLKGEETPIDAVLKHLQSQGISITLTPEELQAVQNAPRLALEEWKKQGLKSQSLFANLDTPTGKEATIDIIINTSTNEEPDPLDIAIEDLHEKLPESENSLSKITEELLTHNPSTFRVNLLDTSFVATKTPSGQWKSSVADAAALEAVEKIQFAEDTLQKFHAFQAAIQNPESQQEAIPAWEQEVPELARNTILLAHTNAQHARALHHITEIPKTIESLPESLLTQSKIQEITRPLLLRSTQIHDAKRALALCQTILSDWNDNELGEPSEWSFENTVINPEGLIDFVIQKITGHTNPTEPAAIPKYFTGSLFTPKDKEQAAFRLSTEGKPAAAFFIKETLAQNVAKLMTQTSAELPGLIHALEKALDNTLQRISPEVEQAFLNHPGIKKILEDRQRYPLLEQKIKNATLDRSLTKGTTHEITGFASMKQLPDLLYDMKTALQDVFKAETIDNPQETTSEEDREKLPTLEEVFINHPNISTIISEHLHSPIIEKRIKRELTDFCQSNGNTDKVSRLLNALDQTHQSYSTEQTSTPPAGGNQITREQIGRDILPGNGIHQNIHFTLKNEGRTIETNKLWTAAWLQTDTAQQQIQNRINLATWIRESGLPPAHAIAYLSFCRQGSLSNIPGSIQAGHLSPKNEAAIIEVAQRFSESLQAIGIPADASLRTTLHGAFALNEYTNAKTPNLTLWDPEWEKPLTTIQPAQEELSRHRLVAFTPTATPNSVALESPFKEKHLIAKGDSVEEHNIENFNPAEKLQAAIKGINIEYTDHLTKYSPAQSFGMI